MSDQKDVVARLRELLLFDETTGHRLFDHERETISEAADTLKKLAWTPQKLLEAEERIAELEAERKKILDGLDRYQNILNPDNPTGEQ